jgi:hypothetical protein
MQRDMAYRPPSGWGCAQTREVVLVCRMRSRLKLRAGANFNVVQSAVACVAYQANESGESEGEGPGGEVKLKLRAHVTRTIIDLRLERKPRPLAMPRAKNCPAKTHGQWAGRG